MSESRRLHMCSRLGIVRPVRIPSRTRAHGKELSSEIRLTGTEKSVEVRAVNRPGSMLLTRIPYSAIGGKRRAYAATEYQYAFKPIQTNCAFSLEAYSREFP